MVLRAAKKKVRRYMPKTILRVKQTSPKFIIVLTVMSLIFFYILTYVLSFLFDLGGFRVPITEAFFLMTIGLPVAFAWYLIDQPPHYTFWDFVMIITVFIINILILTLIGPKLMPSIFEGAATTVQTSVQSLIGFP